MKNMYYFAFLSILCTAQLSAQDYFHEPYVKIGNTVLICEQSKSFDRYHIRDASFDTTHYVIKKPENVSISNIKFKSQKAIHHVFCEVFSFERLKELSISDKILDAVFYVNNKGLVFQTYYTIAIDSSLQPSELVKLDVLIKQKIRFTTEEFEKTGNVKLHFSQLIRYEKIVNGDKIRPLDEWEYP